MQEIKDIDGTFPGMIKRKLAPVKGGKIELATASPNVLRPVKPLSA
jgi:predicted ATPase